MGLTEMEKERLEVVIRRGIELHSSFSCKQLEENLKKCVDSKGNFLVKEALIEAHVASQLFAANFVHSVLLDLYGSR